MDQKIEVKEEPVWLEGKASTSFDNYELTSDEMHLKEGTKLELAEPGQTQPSTHIKDEISIDEPTVGQLVACLKEEENVPVDTGDSSCRILKKGSDLMCDLQPHNTCDTLLLSHYGKSQIYPISERVFCCKQCGGKFSQKSYLHHLRIHPGERIYYCSVCGKRFPKKEDLTKHLISHREEQPHLCHQCGRRFRVKGSLNDHMITHTALRPHVCQQCCKTFSKKGHLTRHINTHTGKRKASTRL